MSTENNKLIAEFMGVEEAYNPNGNDWVLKTTTPDAHGDTDILESCKDNELQYHCSWDWLMPVVEKIESDERHDVNILQYGTIITDNQSEWFEDIGYHPKELVNNIANVSFDKKIEHTYDAVVKFINTRKVKGLISKLKSYDLDGETTQFILEEIGMDYQMYKQLNVKYNNK